MNGKKGNKLEEFDFLNWITTNIEHLGETQNPDSGEIMVNFFVHSVFTPPPNYQPSQMNVGSSE